MTLEEKLAEMVGVLNSLHEKMVEIHRDPKFTNGSHKNFTEAWDKYVRLNKRFFELKQNWLG